MPHFSRLFNAFSTRGTTSAPNKPAPTPPTPPVDTDDACVNFLLRRTHPLLFLSFSFSPQQTMRHTLSERSRRVSNERPGKRASDVEKQKTKKNRTTGTAATLLLPANERHNAAPRSSTDCGIKAGQTRALPRRADALGQNTNRRGVCGSLPKSRRKNRIRHDFFLVFFFFGTRINKSGARCYRDGRTGPSFIGMLAQKRKKKKRFYLSVSLSCSSTMLKKERHALTGSQQA